VSGIIRKQKKNLVGEPNHTKKKSLVGEPNHTKTITQKQKNVWWVSQRI
jgi:hypothetical protein